MRAVRAIPSGINVTARSTKKFAHPHISRRPEQRYAEAPILQSVHPPIFLTPHSLGIPLPIQPNPRPERQCGLLLPQDAFYFHSLQRSSAPTSMEAVRSRELSVSGGSDLPLLVDTKRQQSPLGISFHSAGPGALTARSVVEAFETKQDAPSPNSKRGRSVAHLANLGMCVSRSELSPVRTPWGS